MRKSVKLHIPVHFHRIMNNIEKQLYIQGDFMVDITPLEVMELVEETLDSLNQTELIKPNELFKIGVVLLS